MAKRTEFELNTDLKFVQKQFLCCVPVKQIKWKNRLKDMSWETQELLLDLTVKNPLVLHYPVKISYQQAFLKVILKSLKNQNIDIHDEVYNIYCKLLVGECSDMWFYKHYVFEFEKFINLLSIKENSAFISQGTTGLCSWQAALALSEWCMSKQHLFNNKSVLELGSGTGLLGLALWYTCKPRSLYLSDCHPNVLALLCENIKNNVESKTYNNTELLGDSGVNQKPLLTEKQSDDCRIVKMFTDSDNRELAIINLPWEEVSISNVPSPDIILAADVIYDNLLLQPLCEALDHLIGWNDKERFALVACTVRNYLTVEEFLKISGNYKLKTKELDPSPPNGFLWCPETPMTILKVCRQ